MTLQPKLPLAPRLAALFVLTGSQIAFSPLAHAQEGVPGTMEWVQRASERGATMPLTEAGDGLTVDGDLDDWAEPDVWPRGAALLVGGLWRHVAAPNQPFIASDVISPPDAGFDTKPDAALVRLAFDREAIYVAARVADAQLVGAPDGASPETGDAFSLRLDFRDPAQSGNEGLGGPIFDPNGSFNPRATFGLIVPAPARGDGEPLTQDDTLARSIAGARVITKRVEGGYQIEMRLPLSGMRAPNGQNVSPDRLKQPLGAQFHVFDRDAPFPPGAGKDVILPPAPSTTWTRDERSVYQDRDLGEAWGLVWAGKGAAPRGEGAFQGVQLSAPLWKEGALSWRVASFRSDAAGAGEIPGSNAAAYLGRSFFDVLDPARRPDFAATPTEWWKAGQNAPEAQTELGPVREDVYPSLGLRVRSREVIFKRLPTGRLKITASAGTLKSERNYLVSNYGLSEVSGASLEEPPTLAKANGWLQEGYWNWRTPKAVVGQPLSGDLIVWMGREGANQHFARIAALSLLQGQSTEPIWGADLSLQQQTSLDKDGKPVWGTPKTAWQTRASLTASGLSFQIPGEALAEPGTYRLRAELSSRAGGKATLLAPKALTDQVFEVAVAVTPDAPQNAKIWPATVSDAPTLLQGFQSLGTPAGERFRGLTGIDAQARGIKDLQIFENRLFTGDGDDNTNRAPSDVWSLDLRVPNGPWRKDGTFPEEVADLFRVVPIGGQDALLFPGIDPSDSLGQTKELGNLYVKRPGSDAQKDAGWVQQRTIPKSGWTADIQSWRGALYASTVSGASEGRLQVSKDGGLTWNYVASEGKIEPPAGLYLNQMAPLQSVLMIFANSQNDGSNALLYDGQGWKARRFDFFGGQSFYNVGRATPFPLPDAPDALLYTPQFAADQKPLFLLRSLDDAGGQVVAPFQNAQVRDILARDGAAYVLTGKLTREAGEDGSAPAYSGEVFTSRDLKNWTRLALFAAPALPNALETHGGAFYVGLQTRRYDARDAAAGAVLRLAP